MSVSTHRTSVAVRVFPSAHTGRLWLSMCVCQHTQDVRGCPCVSVSTHRTSVAVRVCPCVSVSTHRTSMSVHQYTYQHVGPWTQHADPSRGLFGCFWPTWAVCSLHTRRPWVSTSEHRTAVAVRVCPCVSVSTHRTSVAVHQYTYQHVGPWTQHAGPSRGMFG